MAGKLKWAVALAAGYVLGARAGRERYEQIAEQARKLSSRPEVRNATSKVREQVNASVDRAAGRVGIRLREARTSDTTTAQPQQGQSSSTPVVPGASSGLDSTGPSTGVDDMVASPDPTPRPEQGRPG
jgi:hypothetical protein